ncbi:MAG: tRNA (adenosine(37)-N6)-dimethylallyltransferase MiaA [Deltaproteobacteria bacterium]|nr:MAG: tRNA (adenosine(37)-N6)-dimethylallyltransferase MiaA [Deltaproteobacteria bacterium]
MKNHKKNLPGIIIICGPTGIGKTALTTSLYKKFPSVIISADSVSVYKYMDIGSAKPTKEENKKYPHNLIDICLPDEDFDAGKFLDLAEQIIYQAHNEKKTTIISGGTGLYIKTLTNGIFRNKPADKKILTSLYEKEKNFGRGYLYGELKKIDPEASKKIHKNDIFRLARAVECYISTGTKISTLQKNQRNSRKEKFKFLKIGLSMERKNLYKRIEKRVDIMIKQGLVKEVEALREMGYNTNLKSMNSIGYKQINMYLDNKIQLEEAIGLIKRDSRRYAKRQMTWFNAQKDIAWISPDDIEGASRLIEAFLKTT